MKSQTNTGSTFEPEENSKQFSLTMQEMITYEKFLLMITDRTVTETNQYCSIMDHVIEELQKKIEIVQGENSEYEDILDKIQNQFNRLAQEKRSENYLLDYLQPKMEALEKITNTSIQKRKQLLQSCSLLNEVTVKQAKQIYFFVNAELIGKKKEETIARLKDEINWQEKQINRLYKVLNQSEAQNEEMFIIKKKLNNDLQEVKGNIRVYCRIRPPKNGNSILSVTSDNTLKIRYERQRNRQETEKYQQGYMFEQIFNEGETQHSIFTELSQLIQNSIDGKSVCIFAYGQTGSGKTYTLLGNEDEDKSLEQSYQQRGLASRSFELIFRQIEHSRKFKWIFKAYLSIQEIYLQNIIDLIAKTETEKDKCTEVEVSEVDQVLAYLNEAVHNRKKACTHMNEHSSRSHLIITLRLQGFSERNEDKRNGSLVFVDLAGSQRLKQSKVEGDSLKQTLFINKSLSSLGTVINQMRKESDHISFRNSKLTHVLQKYLQGESKTLMFVNISPDPEDISQTKISLSFAEGVRECKVKKT